LKAGSPSKYFSRLSRIDLGNMWVWKSIITLDSS
jgi:hypothetical protein